jgi:hypothetical protein
MIGLLTFVWLLVPAVGLPDGQSADQTKCTLSAAQSPAIRGIQLGMNSDQLLALFPESPANSNAVALAAADPNYGVARLSFQPPFLSSPAKERFVGIDSIQTTLFDGSVSELRITYVGSNSHPAKGPFWRNVDDFITKLSDAFALPPAKEWLESSQVNKTLQCTGFTVDASIANGTGSIALRIATAYEDTVRQRALADQEKRRREFKP